MIFLSNFLPFFYFLIKNQQIFIEKWAQTVSTNAAGAKNWNVGQKIHFIQCKKLLEKPKVKIQKSKPKPKVKKPKTFFGSKTKTKSFEQL